MVTARVDSTPGVGTSSSPGRGSPVSAGVEDQCRCHGRTLSAYRATTVVPVTAHGRGLRALRTARAVEPTLAVAAAASTTEPPTVTPNALSASSGPGFRSPLIAAAPEAGAAGR